MNRNTLKLFIKNDILYPHHNFLDIIYIYEKAFNELIRLKTVSSHKHFSILSIYDKDGFL